MKKNNPMRIIICVLSLIALLSATAFAQAGQTPDSTVLGDAEYMTVEGIVTDVIDEKDSYTIKISNDDMGMVFIVQEGTFVFDQKTNKFLKTSDIKKDMELVAIVSKNAPMTMSIPPQTAGAIGFVVKNSVGAVNVSVYNDELMNAENTLKLNIGNQTIIADVTGNTEYTADSLKGSECLVLYTIATASIPPQTPPEFVMILNTADQLNGDSAVIVKAEYTELRVLAEAKGYKVTWASNQKPIVLTKNDMTVEITIGSDEFTFTHDTRDIKPLDTMKILDLPVKLENGKTMVPNTFIDALQ